jgi:hypothetical protein
VLERDRCRRITRAVVDDEHAVRRVGGELVGDLRDRLRRVVRGQDDEHALVAATRA